MANDPWESAAPSAGPTDPWETPTAPTQPPSEATPMSWSDVGKGAVTNAGPSALQFGKDIIQPFIHPIETAENIKNLGHGVLQKTGILAGSDQEKYADAVGKFFVDRYGSIENIKKTLATDPVGIAGDLSMFLTGGGSAAARAPGIIGKAGQVASTVGRTIDPISVAANAVKTTGKVGSELIGGLGTHTGGESLRIAAKAGYEGGEAAKAFRENLRDIAPMEETVAAAKEALGNIRKERGEVYRGQMAKIGADRTVLDFDKIDKAYTRASGIKNFKGQDLSPTTSGIRKTLMDTIDEWRHLDPKEFHTPEGLDALKQKIGDIRDGTQYGTPERVLANQIYGGVRQTIVDQAPAYAKVMKGYEDASKQIKDIERTLSLNPNATVDTSLRKLQSVLRDNVNTSYGRRKELASYLIDAGAPHLMEKLSGQALKPWIPRGLGKLLGGEIIAAGAGAFGAGATGAGAAALGVAPFMSPRLMGEGAYLAGRVAKPLSQIPTPRHGASFQIGRTEEQQPQAQQKRGGRIEQKPMFSHLPMARRAVG